MMDIFDKQVPLPEEEYGASGDMKKTQYILQLLGTPWDQDTLKCIIAAAEQGMELQSGYLNTLEGEQDSQEYRDVSEFGVIPGLKESDYYLAGSNGILSFINARGLGYSLVPKNVNKAAEQDYWVDIALSEAGPNVDILVQEQIVKPMADSSHTADETAMSSAKKELTPVLDALEKQIGGNPYIVGKYSLADVHWTPIIHLLTLTDAAELVSQRPQINRWYKSLESRKSNCGQDIISFSLLPNMDDIKNKTLSDVSINDF